MSDAWVADAQKGRDGKGLISWWSGPEGKVLLTLGKPGVAGNGPDTLDRTAAAVTAANGDIFVADGHGGGALLSRVVKFSKDCKFVKAWGTKGWGSGEFDGLHTIAMDSKGRSSSSAIAVIADSRSSTRGGRFLGDWKQFGRPDGLDKETRSTCPIPKRTSNRA